MKHLRDYCVVEYGKGLPEKLRLRGSVKVVSSAGVTGTHSEYLYNEPIIVVGRKGNISGVHKIDGPSWVIDTAYAIKAKDGIDRDYLYFFLKYNTAHLASSDQSTAIPSLAREVLYSLPFNPPPIVEQKNIAQKIRQLFQDVDAGETLLVETSTNLNMFKQSILNSAIRGKLFPQNNKIEPASKLLEKIQKKKELLISEKKIKKEKSLPEIEKKDIPYALPEGWVWARLGEVGIFARGKSKHRPRNDERLFKDGKYPLVQTGEIGKAFNSDFKIKEYNNVYNDFGLKQSRIWPKGTLCITIAANIAQIGFLEFDACFPDSVACFTSVYGNENEIRDYIAIFLIASQKHLEEFAPATAQKNINLTILNELLVPVPPMSEMNRITIELWRILTSIESTKSLTEKQLKKSENLKQSILKKAFEGEL